MNTRPNKKKKKSLITPPLLTALEQEIVNFNEAGYKTLSYSQAIVKAGMLQEKAQSEKLHPAYRALLHSVGGIIFLLGNQTGKNDTYIEKTLTQAIKLMTHEALCHHQAEKAVWTRYKKSILQNINTAIYRIIQELINHLKQPIIAYTLHMMLNDTNELTRQSNLQVQESSPSSHLLVHQIMEEKKKYVLLINEIREQLLVLSTNDYLPYLHKSFLLHNFLKIIIFCWDASHYNIQNSFLMPQTTSLDKQVGIIISECHHYLLNTGTPFEKEHTAQETQNDLSLCLLGCQFAMKEGNRSSAHLLINQIIHHIVTPWSKKEICQETIFLCNRLSLQQLVYKYMITSSLENIDSLYQSMMALTEHNDTKNSRPMHISFLWIGLLQICNIRQILYEKVAKLHIGYSFGRNNKKKKNAQREIDPTTLVTHEMNISMIQQLNSVMEQLLNSLSFLENQSTQDNPECFLFLLPTTQKYIPTLINNLPSLALLRTNMNQATLPSLMRWKETLIDLQEFYQSLSICLTFFIENPQYLIEHNDSVEFHSVIHKRCQPELIDLAIELDQTEQLIQSHQENLADKTIKSEQIAEQLLAEQHEKTEKILKKRQKEVRTNQTMQNNNQSNTTSSQNDTLDDEQSIQQAPQEEDNATRLITEAIRAFSRHQYHSAFSCYQQLQMLSKTHHASALEGMLACKTKLLLNQLTECEQLLHHIARNPRTVDPQEADECYQQIERLKKEYDSLIKQQLLAKEEWSDQHSHTSVDFSLSLLAEWQYDITTAWQKCTRAKEAAQQSFALSHFTKTMLLGLDESNIDNNEKREALFAIGYNHKICNNLTQEDMQSTLFTAYQNVFAIGLQALIERSQQNKKKFSESIYTKHKRLLRRYQHVLNAATQENNETTATHPASIETIFSQLNTGLLLTEEKKQTIHAWTTMHLHAQKTRGLLLPRLTPDLMRELIFAWFLNPQLSAYYALLTDLQMLDFMLPYPIRQQEYCTIHYAALLKQLDCIGKHIASLTLAPNSQDTILAHIVYTILVNTLPITTLKENLVDWANPILPLHQLSAWWQLSDECQINLYSLLSTKIASYNTNEESTSSLNLLRKTAITHNNRLVAEMNLTEKPWYLFIYGGYALAPLTGFCHHANDIDVYTNIPLAHFPFPCILSIDTLKDPPIDTLKDPPRSIQNACRTPLLLTNF